MNYVPQLDRRGCLVACVAMVTGQTYERVRAELPPGHDLEREGLSEWQAFELLRRFGYSADQMGRQDVLTRQPRPQWPPAPFAPAHILVGEYGAGAHAVVWLPDGTVLDPYEPGRFPLARYERAHLHYVLGVFAHPRRAPEDFLLRMLSQPLFGAPKYLDADAAEVLNQTLRKQASSTPTIPGML